MYSGINNRNVMTAFAGIICPANRCISSDYRMIVQCKPYLDKYDEVDKAFSEIDFDSADAAERLLEGLEAIEKAWELVVIGWATATQAINPSLRADIKRISEANPLFHVDHIRKHIQQAMDYLCDEQGNLIDEEQVNKAIEFQRSLEADAKKTAESLRAR
ncbi:MAG: hypothetical protein GY833_23030 [Aestuariibacter sp.]|nr:hypothetical protein [Aestuariibacter sp.]|tara:strand:- start:178326 stop:178805 length:480 start_codon:yes stop_codon:yes gene_type:complete